MWLLKVTVGLHQLDKKMQLCNCDGNIDDGTAHSMVAQAAVM